MPRALRRGTRLGKYRLDRAIGKGSFGAVWKARDTVEGRFVALKVADAEKIEEHGRAAIEHEARVARRLDHPNVLKVYNADWIDGQFVLATELAERSLADYVGARRSGPIALSVIRDIAAGLAHAHERGVLHRDVKPENVMIFKDRRAALGDFGVWRLAKGATATYTEAGTLGYMAPEQAYGRPRLSSDVFSVGLIAYELLTGKIPGWPFEWPPPNAKSFLAKAPPPVQPVLRKAASFDPKRRYPDAMTFHHALELAFDRAEQAAAPKPRKRRRTQIQLRSPMGVEAEHFRRRHGAALGMRYRCHRCDGPIAEAMAWCPWCGSPDNSFREITRYPLVCPECERGVRAEWTACPWCYPGRLEGNGRETRPDASAERSCPRRGCDGELRLFMRYCPECKQKPKRPWSHPDLPDRCPRCRWPVSKAHWRHCPWCGRREAKAGSFS
ncbi:MAG: protein kinase [Deltaproteobacteria bacterium]|nr:protein kinase [Deltaproteobacteria bacterium]MBW2394490.1 protein kinase [Deltaproteobacteria bacterium]